MPIVVDYLAGFFSPERTERIDVNPNVYTLYSVWGWKRVQEDELLPTFVLKTIYFINIS